MAQSDYLPDTELGLKEWSINFNSRITSPSGPYGLLPGQVTGYTALHNAYVAALTTATQHSTRTPSSIVAKNLAKEALINGTNGIRQLVNIIQADPDTTDVQRADLQITVKDIEPSPVPIPAVAPILSLERTLGRTARLRLRDAQNPDRRGKPDGVKGATIFMFQGETPPVNPREWSFLQSTTRTLVDIEWPIDVPSGSNVWVTAFWFNTKAEASPPAMSLNVPVGFTMAQVA